MRRGTRRGFVLLQVVCSSALALLVGAMLVMFVRITAVSQQLTMDQHTAELTGWRPMHRLADNLRKAQSYGTGNPTLLAATSSSLTLYDDSLGNTSQYWLDSIAQPHTLNRTRASTTQMLAIGIVSLKFTYYLATGNTPVQGACWVTTASPNAPSAAEMPNVVAVGITITMPLDGATRDLTTTVRIRNAPRTVSGH